MIKDANYFDKTKIIGSQIPPLSGSAGFGLGQGSLYDRKTDPNTKVIPTM